MYSITIVINITGMFSSSVNPKNLGLQYIETTIDHHSSIYKRMKQQTISVSVAKIHWEVLAIGSMTYVLLKGDYTFYKLMLRYFQTPDTTLLYLNLITAAWILHALHYNTF